MTRALAHNEGTALLATVVFVIIVSIMASGFIAIVNTNLTGSNRAVHDQICRALAEAGIEKAAVTLRGDAAYSGEAWFKLGKGEVSIDVTALAAPDCFKVTSTARYSDVDPRSLRIIAELARVGDAIRVVRWTEAGK